MSTLDIRIDNLVYGGDGIGRLPDGRTVFVPYTIPGELTRIRLVEEKPHYCRAELVEVIEPSRLRVAARCAHFGTCGGCHYQHMNYPAQLEAKSAILREQLERIGGLTEIPPVEIVPAPDPWNYRNAVQFHLSREGKLGFQKARSNQTFAIRECHLPDEAISQAWPQIEIEPVRGLKRINLRSGMAGELMLVLESDDPQPLDFTIEALPISIVQQIPSGSLVLAGSDLLIIEILGKQFRVSSASFFQVNTALASEMVGHLLTHLPLDETMTVLDVYCGVGLFSAFLAPRVKQLVGIELSPQSCDDFTTNLDEFDHVSIYEASAEDVLNGIDFHPDVVVMDPPREGLGVKTTQGLLSQGAKYLAYVSCDPATLARDSKPLMAGGYRLEKITLFDMFPQTYHLESITYWKRP